MIAPGYTHSEEDLRSHVVTPNQFFVTSSIRFVGEANYPYSSISPDIDYEVGVVISFSSNYIIMVFAGEQKHNQTGPGPINLNSTLNFGRIRTSVF